MAELFIAALLLTTTIMFVWYAWPISRTAIRTGRLLARGTVYSRDDSPKMFFGGLAFWILLSLFLIALTFISIENALALLALPVASNLIRALVSVSAAIYVTWVLWRMATTGKVWVKWQPYPWRERPFWFAGAFLSLVLLLLFLLLASAAMIKRLLFA
jgi:hypothetical protein